METFYILTEAMYQSLGQAIIIYLVSRAVLLSFPSLTADARYTMLYVAQCVIFILFLSNIYSIGQEWRSVAMAGKEGMASEEPAPVRFISLRSLVMSNAPTIGTVYLLGLLVQILLLIPGLVRLRELKKTQAAIPALWYEKLEQLSNKLAITSKIRLVSGTKASIPFTAGFLKPVIYLPITAFNALSTEQAEAILLHELAHIKRNDYLFNLVQKVIEMLMFFNPISWAIGSEIRKEREFCCDDLVIHYTDPQLYARALFLLEQNRLPGYSLAMAANGNKENSLLERIKRITQMNKNTLSLKPGMYALLGFLAAGLSIAWIGPEPSFEKKDQKTTVNAATAVVEARLAQEIVPVPFAVALLDTVPGRDSVAKKKYFNNPEWKKQSEEMKKHSEELKKHSEEIKKHFESPEWKKEMADIQKHSQQIQKHFNSPEWKKHMEELKNHSEEISKEIQKYFNSPEWKKQQEMMAQHGEKMKKHFESPEWKARMKEMEKLGVEMEKKFNSPEFKQKMKQMELEMEKKFDSPEWKEKMQKLELRSKELEKKFESPEWKNKMKELELHGKEMEKKFNSPEWKKKVEKLEQEAAESEKETKL